MSRCVIKGCSTYKRIQKKKKIITLHGFPKSTELIKIWLLQTGQNFEDIDAFVNKVKSQPRYYRMCSWHFTADSYYNLGIQKKLKPEAVPTIFKRPEQVPVQYVRTTSHRDTFDGSIRIVTVGQTEEPAQTNLRQQVVKNETDTFRLKIDNSIRNVTEIQVKEEPVETALHKQVIQTTGGNIFDNATRNVKEEPVTPTLHQQVISTTDGGIFNNSQNNVPLCKIQIKEEPVSVTLYPQVIKTTDGTFNNSTRNFKEEPVETAVHPQVINTTDGGIFNNSTRNVKEEPVETAVHPQVINTTDGGIFNNSTRNVKEEPVETAVHPPVIKITDGGTFNNCTGNVKEDPVNPTLHHHIIKTKVGTVGSEIGIGMINNSMGPIADTTMGHTNTVPQKPVKKTFAHASVNTLPLRVLHKSTITKPNLGFKHVSSQTVKTGHFTNTTGTCTIPTKKSDVGMWTGQLYQDKSTSTTDDKEDMKTSGGTKTQTEPFKCMHCHKLNYFNTSRKRKHSKKLN
ncbi:uncharacterized protein O3C94_005997 isoform 1-T3 [Discoglossus pictus]